MTAADVQQEILGIFKDVLGIEVPSPDHDLLESGLLDSLALVDLIFQLEQRFAAEIDLESLDLERWRNVSSIAAFVEAGR
ncbi:MAG: phosphopantetheine-binding protein [Acidobacteriota bacterium]|jgi:acyl carrier protein